MTPTPRTEATREAKQESERLLNFLAGMPRGNCTASSSNVVREMMLQTGGRMMASGDLWDLRYESLGGGVYRMTLRRWEATHA